MEPETHSVASGAPNCQPVTPVVLRHTRAVARPVTLELAAPQAVDELRGALFVHPTNITKQHNMKRSAQAFVPFIPLVGSSSQNKAISLSARSKYASSTKHASTLHIVTRATPTAVDSLVLTEDNVNTALDEAKLKLGSIFGNSKENQQVGITGDVLLASLDGPVVVLRLQGRFWHKRSDVLARVSAYLTDRIPEICDVEIEDVQQLEDSEAESNRLV